MAKFLICCVLATFVVVPAFSHTYEHFRYHPYANYRYYHPHPYTQKDFDQSRYYPYKYHWSAHRWYAPYRYHDHAIYNYHEHHYSEKLPEKGQEGS